jgi:tRNA threonylcarbamoyladenosine biosynthesis protein TsaB
VGERRAAVTSSETIERRGVRILALETSALRGTVTVLEDGRVLGQSELTQRTAQALAPAIVRQLEAVGWRPQDIQLIAVTQGPGSFTGLRVGVTTAKTLAYAVGAELVAVNTLEVIASQAPADVVEGDIWAVLDAQRQQLFAALFRRDSHGVLQIQGETRIIDNAHWLAELKPPVAVTGLGLRNLVNLLPTQITIIDDSQWEPQAAAVGQLAYRAYQSGRRDDLWTLTPHYYRQSAAEEKFTRAKPRE